MSQALLHETVQSTPDSQRYHLHVDQAPALVSQVVTPLADAEIVPVWKATGRILKKPIFSTVPVPPFDHSAVDGYGVRSKDIARPETTLPVDVHIAAGELVQCSMEGSAVRIMTGAPIPFDCDAVVKQEHVLAHRRTVTITDVVHSGANIRRIGEDVGPGDILVRAGTVLDTRHIALLAACGVAKIPVARRVRVAIAAFGNELRKPGSTLRRGQIFDANSAMAAALLHRSSCQIVECARAGDDQVHAAELLRDLSADVDLIVTSGGMAGGDADHTRCALERAGGLWKEAAFNMKPGKPARLGRIGRSVVLGLPGNPFAALVALLNLGLPIVGALSGGSRAVRWLSAQANFELERRPGRTEFFPARIGCTETSGLLTIERLGRGGSARLKPLVDADGLGKIDEQAGAIQPGHPVEFLPFASLLA